MREGIAVAGTMLVDHIYGIDRYPDAGDLATISDPIAHATGGLVCNVIVDLARLDPTIPLRAVGVVGDDENGRFIEKTLAAYPNIDLSAIAHEGVTSFTDVMSDIGACQRTFFHYRGANALLAERHFDWTRLDCRILHIGYLLLLDALDQSDEHYGTRLARLLHEAQSKGIATSIDLVAGQPDRFRAIVPPVLPYTDYCVINESEAGYTTGIAVRENGVLLEHRVQEALEHLREMGVARWAVIHAPEGGYGLDCITGEQILKSSLTLPDGYIQGSNGAGDAFCAGVLYGAYRTVTLEAAIELGIGCAAASLSSPAATDGMRSYDEVLRLYRKYRYDEKPSRT